MWYIYWDADFSGDRRDDQILAIDYKGGESCKLTYDDLCARLERDFWDDIFPDRTQPGVLRQAVADFLYDMEAKFPNG